MKKNICCPARDCCVGLSVVFAGVAKRGAHPADSCWSWRDQDEMGRARRICP